MIPEREIYRPAPPRALDEAMVPLAHAASGGLVVSLAVLALSWWIGQHPTDIAGWIKLWFVTFSLSSLGVWLWSMRRDMIYLAETVTQHNLDDNPAIGNPAAYTHPMVPNMATQIRERENEHIKHEQARFQEYMDACYTYNPDLRTLTSLGFSPNTPNPEIARYRQHAVDCGLLKWKSDTNRNLGVVLVYKDQAKANAVIERLQWTRPSKGGFAAPTPPMNVGW
jgi:hypothetical protein